MDEETHHWRVREYGSQLGDYQMVSGWSEERGKGRLMENTLPPHGIIVECDGQAVAASWIYLCYGIGVGFWEGLITRPGLSLASARTACGHCVGALKAVARANDVGLIKAYCRPGLARQAGSFGFHEINTGYTGLISTTV
jgi:hypothetical protein